MSKCVWVKMCLSVGAYSTCIYVRSLRKIHLKTTLLMTKMSTKDQVCSWHVEECHGSINPNASSPAVTCYAPLTSCRVLLCTTHDTTTCHAPVHDLRPWSSLSYTTDYVLVVMFSLLAAPMNRRKGWKSFLYSFYTLFFFSWGKIHLTDWWWLADYMSEKYHCISINYHDRPVHYQIIIFTDLSTCHYSSPNPPR